MKAKKRTLSKSIALALMLSTLGTGVGFAESTITPAAGDTISGVHNFDAGVVGINGTVSFNVTTATLNASNNAVVVTGLNNMVVASGNTITTNGITGNGRGFLVLEGSGLTLSGINDIDTSATKGIAGGLAWEGICLGTSDANAATNKNGGSLTLTTTAGSTTTITSGADVGIEVWAGGEANYNGNLTINKSTNKDANNDQVQNDGYVNSSATSNFKTGSTTTININGTDGLNGYSNYINGADTTAAAITNVVSGATFEVKGDGANDKGIGISGTTAASKFNAQGKVIVTLKGANSTGIGISGGTASGTFDDLHVATTGTGSTGVNVNGSKLTINDTGKDTGKDNTIKSGGIGINSVSGTIGVAGTAITAGTQGVQANGGTVDLKKVTIDAGQDGIYTTTNAVNITMEGSKITAKGSGVELNNGSTMIFNGDNTIDTSTGTGAESEGILANANSKLTNNGALNIKAGKEFGMELYSGSSFTNKAGATLTIDKGSGNNNGPAGILVDGDTSKYEAELGSKTIVNLEGEVENQIGIHVRNNSTAKAVLKGTTNITATGADDKGIYVATGAKVEATGKVTIDMQGTSGAGVSLEQNSFGEFSDLNITASGDTVGALVNNSSLDATGSITTDKGNGITATDGANVHLTNTTITSNSTGTGVVGGKGNGIAANASKIKLDGTNEITTNSTYAPGINLDAASTLDVVTGTLTITTNGGGEGQANSSSGINILAGSTATLATGTTTTINSNNADQTSGTGDGICGDGTGSVLESNGTLNLNTKGWGAEGLEFANGAIANLNGTTTIKAEGAVGAILSSNAALNINGNTDIESKLAGIQVNAGDAGTKVNIATGVTTNITTTDGDGISLAGNDATTAKATLDAVTGSTTNITLKGTDKNGLSVQNGAKATVSGTLEIKDEGAASGNKGINIDGTTSVANMDATGKVTVTLAGANSVGVNIAGTNATGTYTDLHVGANGINSTGAVVDSGKLDAKNSDITATANGITSTNGTVLLDTVEITADNAKGIAASGGIVELTNGTIKANGGMLLSNSVNVTIDNSTITTSTGAADGGGVNADNSIITFKNTNTINTANSVGANVQGLSGHNASTFVNEGDLTIESGGDCGMELYEASTFTNENKVTINKGASGGRGAFGIMAHGANTQYNSSANSTTDINLNDSVADQTGISITNNAVAALAGTTNIVATGANNIGINASVGGTSTATGDTLIAMNGASSTGVKASATNTLVDLAGKTTITAETALNVADGANLNVNTAGGKDVALTGNLLGSGTTTGGVMNVKLDTASSFLTGKANKDTQSINLVLANAAPWNVTASSEVTSIDNTGLINMQQTGNDTYETVATDNYAGNNGRMNMDVDLGSESNGDKLIINANGAGGGEITFRDASLTTGVQVTGEKVLLVVGGAGAAGTTWTPSGLGAAIGNWDKDPTLEKANDGNWYLVKVIPMDGNILLLKLSWAAWMQHMVIGVVLLRMIPYVNV